jgi:hypothetical protein
MHLTGVLPRALFASLSGTKRMLQMRTVPELPLPSPASTKENSQSFSFSNQGDLAIDLILQTAPINFWGNFCKIPM